MLKDLLNGDLFHDISKLCKAYDNDSFMDRCAFLLTVQSGVKRLHCMKKNLNYFNHLPTSFSKDARAAGSHFFSMIYNVILLI